MKRTYSGIYKILNIITNKCYIGSALHIKKRWEQHVYSLNQNTHHSGRLQNSWNKYGENVFKFIVLLYCHQENLIYNEQIAMDKYQASNPLFGYNMRPIAESNLGKIVSEKTRSKIRKSAWRGDKNPSKRSEVKQKISIANKGKTRSLEVRRRISNTLKEHYKENKNPFFGRRHSEETRKKMSDAAMGRESWNKGKSFSKETCKKMSEAGKGKIITPEWREKISISMKGRIFSEETKRKLSIAATKRWNKAELNKIA